MMNRRDFLFSGGVMSIGFLMSNNAWAKIKAGTPRVLTLSNANTGETLKSEYFDGRRYDPQELKRLNKLFRDFRRNESTKIDIELFDYLFNLTHMLEINKTVTLLSGYRAPATNQMLRASTRGVAKKSYHTRGQAMDFRIAGVDIKHLHKAALKLRAGGVGYYPRNNFLHIDTGPFRSW
ncbi:TPA: YcbK family protein [Enterobacter kobei]|nr:YcbK family protein [Enterobacter kobei]HDT4959012.1 YcbK family protein [Enterobacter kobei]